MKNTFAAHVVAWQRAHGRHDLPWQGRDAYAVWVSEIMLQQTQVETVIPYYLRFMARFPDLTALAAASVDEVLALWSGLGYYARGRNLHKAAQQATGLGVFPSGLADLMALPGIGRSTAGAIAALAGGERHAILDGNVRRVLCRAFGVAGWPGEAAVQARLWALAETVLPAAMDIRPYTQGMMDLGATLCTRARPRCAECPLQTDCVAAREGRQADLPQARPKKAIPLRETAMIMLLHAGQVLLERRPPTGIWGGLWSLPEAALDTPTALLEQQFGGELEELAAVPSFVHVFSHFRLHIQPRRFAVRRWTARAESPGRVWLPLTEIAGAALPTPVRQILNHESA
jgi:A/G-specific adenine glycosylase